MTSWKLQDAKARFSECVNASMTDGPQVITKRGVKTAVLVSVDDWERLKGASQNRRTIIDVLLAPEPRFDLDVPNRRSDKISYDPSWIDEG